MVRRGGASVVLVGITLAVAVVLTVVGSSVVPAIAAPRRSSLQFRPVLAPVPSAAVVSTTAPVDLPAARRAVTSCDPAAVMQLGFVPTTTAAGARAGACVVLPERPGGPSAARYYLGPAPAIPVASARARFVAGQGWTVEVDLTAAGSRAWDRLAEQQFHQQVAMVLDGIVQSAPTIQPNDQTFTSFDGTAVISGSFTKKGATAVAAAARGAN